MGTAGTFWQIAAQTGTSSGSPTQLRAGSLAMAPVPFRNTLHCSSEVTGSAAQFNRSVSAMPRYAFSRTNASGRGTADTLSKG
jgi:hypothetical protein